MSSELYTQPAVHSWSAPACRGELSENGETYRLRWWPGSGVTKIALFRVATCDGVATLQHVRRVVSRQGEQATNLDETATLDDIPEPLLAIMRSTGLEPAEEGSE